MAPQIKTREGKKGELFSEDKRKLDVRTSNIEAAKAVADVIRTSLGPRGMDKMVQCADGEVIITNDGATILNKMRVTQPAAKMLVELSKSQDVVAGDGTTSVSVICGSLLNTTLELINSGIHPTVISDAFNKAQAKSLEILKDMAIPVASDDRESLIRCATTSLSSKVVSQYSNLLSPMAVDCVLNISEEGRPENVDLRNVKIIKKLGGTVDDSELVDGLVLDQRASKSAGGPSKVPNAKIGLIQFCISPPKTDMDNSIVVSDYTQMDRILKEERKYILGIVKKIRASGCNCLLIQKSILRDAVTDIALHYLAKAKILVVRDVAREDIEYISKTLNCLPIAHVDHMKPEKLGFASMVASTPTGSSSVVKITGIKGKGRTASVLMRGSNKLVLDEADRSLHDALCVIRCLVQQPYQIPGGGAPEIELIRHLKAWSKTLSGMDGHCITAFADALEVIPYTLAENAGLNPIQIVTQLHKLHAEGNKYDGINVRKGTITDMLKEQVVQPLLVSSSAINLASECVRMILKIDDIVPVR